MKWHQGDTEPPLTGVTGVDLTGADLCVAHVRRPAGEVISRAATIPVGTAGLWFLPWVAGELDDVGVYVHELEVTWSADRVQTFDGPSFRVLPQIDDAGLPWAPPTDGILDGGIL